MQLRREAYIHAAAAQSDCWRNAAGEPACPRPRKAKWRPVWCGDLTFSLVADAIYPPELVLPAKGFSTSEIHNHVLKGAAAMLRKVRPAGWPLTYSHGSPAAPLAQFGKCLIEA